MRAPRKPAVRAGAGRAVKPTLQVLALLSVLAAEPDAEWYGLALMRAADLKSGTAYPILARLERARWVESHWEDVDPGLAGRPRRRLYSLTPNGYALAAHLLREQRERLRAPSATSRIGRLGQVPG